MNITTIVYRSRLRMKPIIPRFSTDLQGAARWPAAPRGAGNVVARRAGSGLQPHVVVVGVEVPRQREIAVNLLRIHPDIRRGEDRHERELLRTDHLTVSARCEELRGCPGRLELRMRRIERGYPRVL